MQKQYGFTFAEILITLGIIGVVAAVTIPTLVLNNPSSQFKTAYKQSLSKLKQAITMNFEKDNFDFSNLVDSKTRVNTKDEKSFASIISKRFEGATDITSTYFDSKNFSNGVLTMLISGDYACTSEDAQDYADGDKNAPVCEKEGDIINGATVEYIVDKTNFKAYQMEDGTVFGYNVNAAKCTSAADKNCVGFIDVNSIAGPNKVNVCDNPVYDKGVSCFVSNEKIVDIFPVKFYNQTVEPGSVATRSILIGSKANRNK